MPKTTARLLIVSVAAFLALGLGAGTALAAGRSVPTFNPRNNTASVHLRAMPKGMVMFQRHGTTGQATISATGLTPGSTHVAEITSRVSSTPILFSQFTASATGQVHTTISSVGPVGTLPEDAKFQIDLSTSPGQPIAVAHVRSFLGRPARLHAVEIGGRGRLTGHATLSYDSQAKTLTVSVRATGFVPNTSHAAHVHTGSCTVQGPVLIMLQDLRANGDGQIDQTQVVPNVNSFTAPAGGWYLNIHEGPGSAILDAHGNPTIQFRPLLCADLHGSRPVSPAHGMHHHGMRPLR